MLVLTHWEWQRFSIFLASEARRYISGKCKQIWNADDKVQRMGSATGKIEESKATLENSANEAVFSFGETDVSVSFYFFCHYSCTVCHIRESFSQCCQ